MDLIYPYSHIVAFYRFKASRDWSRFAEFMDKSITYSWSVQ